MKLVEGLSYRQWQQRNTSSFKALSKDIQKEIRGKGYYNVGWEKVKKSWKLISELKIVNLIDYKLRTVDINGAIDISLVESEKAQNLASQTINNIREKRQHLNQLVAGTLSKYSNV